MAPSKQPPLVLASQSPRRKELLTQIGVCFKTLAVDVDETPHLYESPADYVLRLALAKARAGWKQAHTPTLSADTAVVLDDRVFGKPRDQAHAFDMLTEMSGRMHEVLTAVALMKRDHVETKLSSSRVWMRELSREEIAAYWASGEPVDKAGGYAIQGFAATFIERLDGSYSGVMGLPLFETAALLRET